MRRIGGMPSSSRVNRPGAPGSSAGRVDPSTGSGASVPGTEPGSPGGQALPGRSSGDRPVAPWNAIPHRPQPQPARERPIWFQESEHSFLVASTHQALPIQDVSFESGRRKRKAGALLTPARPVAPPCEALPAIPLTPAEAELLGEVMAAVKADFVPASGAAAAAPATQRLEVRTKDGSVWGVSVQRDEASTITQVELRRGSQPCMIVDCAAPRGNEEWINGADVGETYRAQARAFVKSPLSLDRLLDNAEGIELSHRCLAAMLRNMIAERPGIAKRLPVGITSATLPLATRGQLVSALEFAADANREVTLSLNSLRFLPAEINDALCTEQVGTQAASGVRAVLDDVQLRSEPLIGVHWGPSLTKSSGNDLRTPLLKWLRNEPGFGTPAQQKLYRAIERRMSPADPLDWQDFRQFEKDAGAATSQSGLSKYLVRRATAVAEKLWADGAGLRRRFEVAQGEPRSSAKASFQMPKEVRADDLMYGVVGEFRRRLERMTLTGSHETNQAMLRSYGRFVSRLGKQSLPREALDAAGNEVRDRCETLFDQHAEAQRRGEARRALKCFLQLPFEVQARIASSWTSGNDGTLIASAMLLAHGLLIPENLAGRYQAPSLTLLRKGLEGAEADGTLLSVSYRDDRRWQRRQLPSLHRAVQDAAADIGAGRLASSDRDARDRIFRRKLDGQGFKSKITGRIVRATSPLLQAVKEVGALGDRPHLHENAQLLGGARDALGKRLDAPAVEAATAPLRDWLISGEAGMMNTAFNVPKETALDFPDFRDFIDAVSADIAAAGKLPKDGLAVEQRAAFDEVHRAIHAQWRDQLGMPWPSHLDFPGPTPADDGRPAVPRDEFATVGRPDGDGRAAVEKVLADVLAQADGQAQAVPFEASLATAPKRLEGLPSRFELQIETDDIEAIHRNFSLNPNDASLEVASGDPASGAFHLATALQWLAEGRSVGDPAPPRPDGLEAYKFRVGASTYLDDVVDDLPSYEVTLTAHAGGAISSAEVVNEDVVVVGRFPNPVGERQAMDRPRPPMPFAS